MSVTRRRQTLLVVIASIDPATADAVALRLRRDGTMAYPVHSLEGCLRVSTAVGPDMILVDPRLPGRLVALLRAHPRTAQARIAHLALEPDPLPAVAGDLPRQLVVPLAA